MRHLRKPPSELPLPKSLQVATAAHPSLTQWGWDDSGNGAPVDREQFELACAYLQAFARPLRSFYVRRGSYGLKHSAEAWAGGYVSNGALIAAAIALGFRHRRDPGHNPNCVFNLKIRRRPRPIGKALRTGNLDRRVLTTLAHQVSEHMGVHFKALWHSLEPAMSECGGDAAELAARIDVQVKRHSGTCMAAFGHVIEREAAR